MATTLIGSGTQVSAAVRRCDRVRFERLVIDSGVHTMAVDLHPRLTVLTGLESFEREALTTEIIGALSTSRPGVHLEVQSDAGTRFAIFRPEGSTPKVIDIDNRLDVTSQFADADGRIDLLDRAGLDMHSARRVMCAGAGRLNEASEGDRLVLQLAAVEQTELWTTAERLTTADRALEREAEKIGSSPEDADAVARIEESHQRFEDAAAQAESVRKVNFLVAGIAALFSIPAAKMMGGLGIAAMAIIAAAAVMVSFAYWRRAQAAAGAEAEALEAAGAHSYLGFHLQRVNGLLGSDAHRRHLLEVAESQRDAQARWAVMAGNVSVEWALEHKASIVAASATGRDLAAQNVGPVDGPLAAATQALASCFHSVRQLGPGGENFPIILEEPFANTEPELVAPLLEKILEQSAFQQILLLTQSAEIESWARLEAMTGALEVVEPVPATL
ncbi:MAG: hypothetical protein ACR2OH_12315 [Microthrixaceae bacterium]